MIQIKDQQFISFIPEQELQHRISQLGQQITEDYRDLTPLIIGVMNGAFMFLSDLSKKIDLSVEISFVKVSSYDSMSSSGTIKPLIGLESAIMGRDVIIVEDIVDTGLSMAYILKKVLDQRPKSIQVVTLLLKPDSLKNDISLKYVGFKIPDKFVVGYGMDYKGYGRNLKEIYQVL